MSSLKVDKVENVIKCHQVPTDIKIDPYNFEPYRFKFYAFFETQCRALYLQ